MNPLDKWETTVTAEDEAYYQQIYQYEGANKSQNDMAPFLRKAQTVSTQQLNQILGAAFQANTTNVDDNKKSFYIALKLIACAQHGINPSSPILSTTTPLPTFEDYEIITSKDRQKYVRIFQASGPTDGFITGDKAMKILMRSKLPVSLLSQIWNLADIGRQGKLDSTGFVIAMHYVAKCMNGNKKSLPHANAPDSILISARGESPSLATMTTSKHSPSLPSTAKPSSTSPPPPPPLPSVSSKQPPVDSTNEYTNVFSPLHQHQPWAVDNAELASYTDSFNKIDTRHKGYIEGSEAVGFFGHSKLPSSDLAGIWDLADTQNRGQLSQDEFAIAMHLIRRARGGSSLPSTLPSSLLSHIHNGNQETLAKQADQLKQSIENEQKEVTTLQQSVQQQDTVVSDLQKQVNTLEQSLQHITKQKLDLQTTLDTLKRTENEKRHKIAQLEKEYNITQTELASLKTTHQQRLTLVGISNSQLASAQSLKDKSAEELALAQNGKFDGLTELSPKANDAPPPPPPSSRHHRTQSLRSQQPTGSSANKKPPAPPPSKKKRSPVPSTPPPSSSENKVATDIEKSLATAVSAGVASVVASSALTSLISSPTPSTTRDDASMEPLHEKDSVVDDDILTHPSVDEKETKVDDTTTLESQKSMDEQIVEYNSNNVDGINNPVLATETASTTHDEPTTDDKSTTAPINKEDIEDAKDSSLDGSTADNMNTTNKTPLEANLTSDVEVTDNAKTTLSEINTPENAIDAKEEPSTNVDLANAPKDVPSEVVETVDESDAKEEPGKPDVASDTTLTKNVPSGASGAENTTTYMGTQKENTSEIDTTTFINDSQQQHVINDDNAATTTTISPSLDNIDDTNQATAIPSGMTDTDEPNDITDELTEAADDIGGEKEQTATVSNDIKTSVMESDDQHVTATIPDVKKDVDIASDGGRTDVDSGDVGPNGSPVVVEPVDSGNMQSLTDGSRTIHDRNTGSPEIHTATTTASGSLKGDDHDFEVVDNASASSSFMSASMGADDDALDEFDAAFSETLPDAKMVLSNTSDANITSNTTVSPSNATPSGFDDDDFDEAFDPKVFIPAKATIDSNQQSDIGQQMDSNQLKNDPFAVHDANHNNNNNSFADAFIPFTTNSSQDVSANVPTAFGDSFTMPQPHTSTDSTTVGAQNEPTPTNSMPAPEFTDLKDLVVSPEQVADYESNPFDEPSFEHPPENKDQLIDNIPSEQYIRDSTMEQPMTPTSAEHFSQFVDNATTTQPIEHESIDNVQTSSQQPPAPAGQDNTHTYLQAPPTVSPSVSTTSNPQSDRQSQQSQQRPSPAAAAMTPVGMKSVDEGHTSSSKGKHKGLFSLSSMLPKQKGKKSKSKSSKKDKSSTSHEETTQQQQQQQQQFPMTMQQHQDPSLENTIPAMSDQEVMANLRDFGIDSESMKVLTSMGFTVDQAKEALERYDYDVQKATNFLLDQ